MKLVMTVRGPLGTLPSRYDVDVHRVDNALRGIRPHGIGAKRLRRWNPWKRSQQGFENTQFVRTALLRSRLLVRAPLAIAGRQLGAEGVHELPPKPAPSDGSAAPESSRGHGPEGGAHSKVCWYDVLGVSEAVTPQMLERAYHAAVRAVQEDAQNKNRKSNRRSRQRTLDRLRRAYDTLKDPASRAAYDAERASTAEAARLLASATAWDELASKRPRGGTRRNDANDRVDALSGSQVTENAQPSSMRRRRLGLRFLSPVAADEPLKLPVASTGAASAPTRAASQVSSKVGRALEPSTSRLDSSVIRVVEPPDVMNDSQLPTDGEINGQVVRRVREARGVSLPDLAEITKISKRYLVAIEEQNLDDLPARVYLRGFLTQVARALKVDKDRLAEGYLAFVERYRRK